MADDLAHGIVRITADVDDAIRDIHSVDREFDKAIRDLRRKKATLDIDVKIDDIKNARKQFAKLSDEQRAQELALAQRRKRTLALNQRGEQYLEAIREQSRKNEERAEKRRMAGVNRLSRVSSKLNSQREKEERSLIQLQSSAYKEDEKRTRAMAALQTAAYAMDEKRVRTLAALQSAAGREDEKRTNTRITAIRNLAKIQMQAAAMDRKRDADRAKSIRDLGNLQLQAAAMDRKITQDRAKAWRDLGLLQLAAEREDVRRTEQQRRNAEMVAAAVRKSASQRINDAAKISKLQEDHIKQQEKLSKIQAGGRGPIRGNIGSVQQRVRIDSQRPKAEMARLTEELRLMGADPIVVDVDVKGENRLASLLKSLSEMTVRVGPFTATIRQFVVVLALLGPMLVGLTGALTSLVGVLGTGLVGALTLSTAALGGFALAAGGIFAVVKPMAGELGKVRKAQEAVVTAGEKYGRWSKEASAAQEKLNNLLKGVPKDAEQAIASIGTLGERWENLTKSSRPTFFRMIAAGVTAINELMPTFAANSNVALSQVTRGFEGWMQGITSGDSRRDLANIFSGFNAAIPPLMRGLGHIGTALRNIAAETAPYLRPLAGVFNSWAKGIADSTSNTPKLESSIFRLVEHAKSLGRFMNAAGDVIRTVLNGGADDGKGMLDTMTELMNKWDEFLRSTEGKNEMARFFKTARDLAGKFWDVLSGVVSVFFSIATAMAPVTAITWGLFAALAKTVAKFLSMEGVQSIITGIGAAMSLAFGAKILGGLFSMIKAIGGITGALKIVFALIMANPWIALFGAIIAITIHLWKTNEKFRDFVTRAWEKVKGGLSSLKDGFQRIFGNSIPDAINRGKNLIATGVNKIIDIINLIPGVKIPKLTVGPTGGGGSGVRAPSNANANVGNGGRRMPAMARGGIADAPQVLIGEEAPRHPEYVIPTNPAYRGRAMGLFEDLGRKLGVGPDIGRISAYKKGGKIDSHAGHGHGTPGRKPGTGGPATEIAGLPIKALTQGAKWFTNKLPNMKLPGWLAGAGKFALDKAKQYIKEKASFLGGGLGNGAGSLGNVTNFASRFGLQVTSGYRAGDPGYHGLNRARDYSNGSGPTQQQMAFARFMSRSMGGRLAELIYTPLGYSIKDGQKVAPYAQADHYDHVHVAMAKGGKVSRSQAATLASTGMPGLKRGGVAQRAIQKARQMGASRKVIKALIAAGIVESGLQHDKYLNVGSGDRDSVGFLQQRPSQGWGRSRSMARGGVETDTAQFVSRAMALVKSGFKGGAGKLAQAVQRSAFPRRYAEVGPQAERIMRQAGVNDIATGRGGAPTRRERATSGRTTDLANRLAQQQGVLDFATRTDKARDDVRAIMGFDQRVRLTKRDRRSIRRRIRNLPLHRSSVGQLKELRRQLRSGTKTVRRSGLLDLKLQERDVQRARLNKIDKALRGKLRPSTRTRLLEEKAQLQSSLAQGRAERAGLREQARNAPDAARRARFDTRTEGLETGRAEASLTSGLGDDLTATNALYDHWSRALESARARKDNAGIQEAIGNVTNFGRDVEELRQRMITEPLETELALASLKSGLDDDLTATNKLLDYWRTALSAAQASGDSAAIRAAVGQVNQYESEAAALAERIATDPIEAGRALARLTEGAEDDVEWTNKLLAYYEPLLEAAKAANDYQTITRLAPIVGGLRSDVNSAPTMASQIGAFNAARQDLYRNMGSNYSPVTQPAAATSAGGNTIINNFAAPPADPHTWVQQQKFELQSAL